MFEDQTIEPIDTCGCGDTGYLTIRTIPIDLKHGVGHIDKVPVYHCRSKNCQEYTIPAVVSRRLETIAEEMERSLSTQAVFTWETPSESDLSDNQFSFSNEQTILQTFTLQFNNRQYADAHVVLVIPGQDIFLKSCLDEEEYYLLHYEPDKHRNKLWFSFFKFYYKDLEFTYEKFLKWLEDGYLKELGQITLQDIENALIDEFGDWT